MKEHLYFQSSNLEYSRFLQDDVNFEPIHEYDLIDFQKITPYEWGRIKTGNNYIHLILGTILNNNCPWCKEEPYLKKVLDGDLFNFSQFCLVCPNCGSRGPVLNVRSDIEPKTIAFNQWFDLLNARYARRLSWDHGFKKEKK